MEDVLAAIRCPMCHARLEVMPGRVACPACLGRFDVVPTASPEGGPFRMADGWETIAEVHPPEGVADESGGPVLRSVKVGRHRMDIWTVITSVLWIAAGVLLIGAGMAVGHNTPFVLGFLCLGFGLIRIIVGPRARQRWVGEVITLTREGLQIVTVNQEGSSVRELALRSVVEVSTTHGHADSLLIVLRHRDGVEIARGQTRPVVEWLLQYLQRGIEVARRLTRADTPSEKEDPERDTAAVHPMGGRELLIVLCWIVGFAALIALYGLIGSFRN
jgi:hypothetical protein